MTPIPSTRYPLPYSVSQREREKQSFFPLLLPHTHLTHYIHTYIHMRTRERIQTGAHPAKRLTKLHLQLNIIVMFESVKFISSTLHYHNFLSSINSFSFPSFSPLPPHRLPSPISVSHFHAASLTLCSSSQIPLFFPRLHRQKSLSLQNNIFEFQIQLLTVDISLCSTRFHGNRRKSSPATALNQQGCG